jgi:hypothetical protein
LDNIRGDGGGAWERFGALRYELSKGRLVSWSFDLFHKN